VQVFLNTFGIVEAVLMDLGCLPHGLLISKMAIYKLETLLCTRFCQWNNAF